MGGLVVSSYADIPKLSPDVSSVHFRKFVSKRLLRIVLKKCPNLKKISFSRYAYERLKNEPESIPILISNGRGRPSIIEILWPSQGFKKQKGGEKRWKKL